MILLLWACATPSPPIGILVMSLDTLRADRLGAYGNTAQLTPNLDHFAKESIVFEQAYSQANETLYSHAALFTGQYPSTLAPLDAQFRLPEGTATLASTFHDAGWETAAFVAGGHLSAPFGLNRGFDVYEDASNWGSLRDTTPKALHWLDTRGSDRPFLLFVHGYDTHDRYLKPTPFGYAFTDPAQEGLGPQLAREIGSVSQIVDGVYEKSVDNIAFLAVNQPRFAHGKGIRERDPDAQALTDADKAHIAATYDGAVAWMDACFGLFMAGLEQRGLLERLTIVILSDHGEELGEEGAYHHRYGLNDATTHVPLMIRLPGGASGGRRIAGLTGLIDVAPTLVAQAGLRGLQQGAGQSLSAVLAGGSDTGRSVVISEGALRLLSARGPSARLIWEGFSVQNPLAQAALAVAPVDGRGLSLIGEQAELPTLRQALIDFRGKTP